MRKRVCMVFLLILTLHNVFGDIEGNHDEHGHSASNSNDEGNITDTRDPLKFTKDTGHIREHLKSQYGFDDKRADQYLKEYDAQTQFFVMHDYDGNTKLDGLELFKSMSHYHDENDPDTDGHHHGAENEPENTEDTLVEFVDMILKDQDYN